MKTILSSLTISLLLLSCGEKDSEKPLSMKGAYSMTRQVLNDGEKDSLLDRNQLKIFTNKYVMYASPNITDSFANFGIGQYHIADGKIIEKIVFTGTDQDQRDSSVLLINKNPNGYTQVIEAIPIEGKNYKLTEDYEDVGRAVTSPLDGTWKQVRNIYISNNGDSSVNDNPVEYKIYESGYFIWAITSKDSANRNVSVFGYGTFEMNGDSLSRETVMNSTFVRGLKGRTYEVDIDIENKDRYKQTITFANGDKSVEIYERMQ